MRICLENPSDRLITERVQIFSGWFKCRYPGVLNARGYVAYFNKLKDITNRNISLVSGSSMRRTLRLADNLEAPIDLNPDDYLGRSFQLLRRCRKFGTLPYAVVARHAFIAEALLRSAIEIGVWNEKQLSQLKRKLSSVSFEIRRDFWRVHQGKMRRDDFLHLYGHLRPGLFDILSPRYDQRPDLFSGVQASHEMDMDEQEPFQLNGNPHRMNGALKQAGLFFSAEELLRYAVLAMRSREQIKCRFSRFVSDALECLARWGASEGLSREDVSYLRISDLDAICAPGTTAGKKGFLIDLIQERRERISELRGVRLGPIIRCPRDLYVISYPRANANFVTFKNAQGQPALIRTRQGSESLNLLNKIACVESADPGFDWLFARGLAGLITKFGGSNSHMTIRCAEAALPAAIGVGEVLFDQLVHSERIELSCRQKVVRPLDV